MLLPRVVALYQKTKEEGKKRGENTTGFQRVVCGMLIEVTFAPQINTNAMVAYHVLVISHGNKNIDSYPLK